MADIYQRIWDADQAGNGLQALREDQQGDSARGFVRVKLGPASSDLRLLPEVHIPEHKSETYSLARALFDNYALSERQLEVETPEEREEIHELLHAVIDTEPMRVARDFVQHASGTVVSRDRWYATLLEQWFRQFSQSGDPHLTGFEHVFVGEQEGAKAQGYHFWYKYFLDDGFAHRIDESRFPNLRRDRIEYIRSRASEGQADFPESVTISYRWNAPDYDAGAALRPLTKKIGGFFVGCSVEGLMALGTVRAHLGARAPKEAVINGARYNLKIFRSSNNAHIRTFYPVFLGPAEPREPDVTGGGTGGGGGEASGGTTGDGAVEAPGSRLRIIAALVNPKGHDPGLETVTVVNPAAAPASLRGFRLVDRNGKATPLEQETIDPGAFVTLRLTGAGAQLSNKGGVIQLVDGDGAIVDQVRYTQAQARREGQTLLF